MRNRAEYKTDIPWYWWTAIAIVLGTVWGIWLVNIQ